MRENKAGSVAQSRAPQDKCKTTKLNKIPRGGGLWRSASIEKLIEHPYYRKLNHQWHMFEEWDNRLHIFIQNKMQDIVWFDVSSTPMVARRSTLVL